MRIERKAAVPRPVIFALGGLGCLVLLAAGWFALIVPKRSELKSTKEEIVAKQQQIEDVRSKTAARQSAPKIRVADLYRLSKAMPDRTDIADAVLALNQIAEETGIAFIRIAPQPAVNLPGYQAIPIQLVFQGNFYDLADFVYRLRSLVRVRDGELDASGRLFAVDELDFGPPPLPQRFPIIRATLQVDVFVYGQASAPAAPTSTSSTDTSGTATTTTEPTSTTPTEPTPDLSAAGATP